MKFTRYLAIFKRLPFRHALAYVAMRAARGLFRARAQEHYSQFGEDVRLWGLLGNGECRAQRRYVDVGANHPVRFSNTFRLYIEGWTGITIDGNPDVVALHRRMRPLDTAICAVVSNAVRRVPFICHEVDCLSRIATASEPTDGRVGMVVTQTLDDILAGVGWREGGYDLLNIDVEGHEQEVLQGVDLKRFRPRVIAVEIHGMDLTAPHRSALVEWLMREGYALDSYCRPTAIFVERGCR